MKTLYGHFVIVLLLALVAVPNSLRAGSFTFDFEHPNAVGSSFADAVPLNTPGALTDSLGQPIGFTHSPIGATSFSDATLTPLGLEFEICGSACSINLAIPFPTDGSGIVGYHWRRGDPNSIHGEPDAAWRHFAVSCGY